jgi:hypothetical protein
MTNAKFGSNRAGTWVDGPFGSNRTKKPTGNKEPKVEKPKVEITPKKKVIKKGDK